MPAVDPVHPDGLGEGRHRHHFQEEAQLLLHLFQVLKRVVSELILELREHIEVTGGKVKAVVGVVLRKVIIDTFNISLSVGTTPP